MCIPFVFLPAISKASFKIVSIPRSFKSCVVNTVTPAYLRLSFSESLIFLAPITTDFDG